jgi:5-bromo-4-chloroindolyl phosphate hydrolysis protein
MKKLVGLLITLLALNGCANSLAFLGPASTSVTGGNVAQSIASSAVSYGVKKQTGKNPSQHALAYVQKHNPENKKEKCIEFIDATNTKTCAAVKENLSETRKKLVKIKNTILDKSKIENLAKQSDLIKR